MQTEGNSGLHEMTWTERLGLKSGRQLSKVLYSCGRDSTLEAGRERLCQA